MSNLLSQASLVMIPSGYKEDVVYSAIPTNGNGDLSFTRASNGTRINSAGLVEVVPWNLLQYSQLFQNGVWATKQGTFTDNFAVAPNGTTTACKWEATNSDPYCYQSYNGDNVSYTATCWVKATGTAIGKNCSIRIGGSAVFTAMTGEWQQLIITANINGSVNVGVEAPESATIGEIVYLWGFQLNIGSTAKPYFPTTDRLNVPRLTYQNGGGGCPSLLLEKQSTNLVTYSEDWETNTSGFSGGAFSANQTNSPDGTQNADKFTVNSSTSTHGGYYGATGTASAIYSVSAFIKAGTGRYFLFRAMTDSFSTRYGVTIDLQTGTILSSNTQGSPTGTSSKIEDFGNGWYRVTLTMNTIGTQIAGVWGASNTGTPSLQTDLDYLYAGNGTDSYYMWGMQTEQSSYPTSYIPTTSSSATRVADAVPQKDITSFGIGNSYTLFWDLSLNSSVFNALFWELYNSSSTATFTIRNFNGVLRAYNNIDLSYPLGLTPSSNNKYIIRIDGTSYSIFYSNSGTPTKSTATMTTARDLGYFSFDGDLTDWTLNQHLIFPTALTDTECLELVS
jgi:hypothetical protein